MNLLFSKLKSKIINNPYSGRYVLGGLGILLILVFLLHKETNIVTTTVSYRELGNSVDLFGRIESNQESDIYPQVSGVISSVFVKPGDTVNQGQLLFQLESSEVEAEVASAYANLRAQQARANITKLEYEETAENLVLTKSRLDLAVQNTLQDLLSGDLQAYTKDQDVESPTISGTYSHTEMGNYFIEIYPSRSDSGYSFRYSGLETGSGTVQYEQASPLGTRGLYITFTQNSEYLGVDWVVPIPNIRSPKYTTLKSAYDDAVKNRDEVLNTNQSAVAKKQIEFGNLEGSLSGAQLEQSRAQYTAAIAKRNLYYIRAPFSGIIGYVDEKAKIGQLVGSETRLASVVNNSGFKVRIKIPEQSILRLTEGMPAKVTLDADNNISLAGVLQNISYTDSEIEGSRIYEGEVAITETKDSIFLRSGLAAFVSIETAKPKTVLAIPETAVIKISEQTYVSVQDKAGDFSNKLVVLGDIKSNGLVQVLSGLNNGDVVNVAPEVK